VRDESFNPPQIVTLNVGEMPIACPCRLLEVFGYPCFHIFKFCEDVQAKEEFVSRNCHPSLLVSSLTSQYSAEVSPFRSVYGTTRVVADEKSVAPMVVQTAIHTRIKRRGTKRKLGNSSTFAAAPAAAPIPSHPEQDRPLPFEQSPIIVKSSLRLPVPLEVGSPSRGSQALSESDIVTKRGRKEVKCTLCGRLGHNKRTCNSIEVV